MNRHEVNTISAAVMRLIERHKAEEPDLARYNIAQGAGRFGQGNFDMKLSITPKLTDADKQRIAEQQTPDVLRHGLAPSGTPITFRMRGGIVQRGTIVKARRTRYLVTANGGPKDGAQFTVPFEAATLAAPETANA